MDHRLQLITTPNPLTCEGQLIAKGEFAPGESLRMFLARNVEDLENGRWRVMVNGDHVTDDRWDTVYVMDGDIIEAISVVRESALRLVAFAALMYFTLGAGGIAGGAFLGLSGFAGYAAATAAFLAGGVLINKVLPPVLPKGGAADNARTVYTLGDQRNQARGYGAMPITFGVVDDAMDLLTSPYPWYEGESQYINMVLTPGFNVAFVSDMRFGDNPMANFDEVTVKYHNFSDMPEQPIDLLTDVDSISGGTLEEGVTVIRTSSDESIGLQVDVEYLLFDTTSKGQPKDNTINLNIQYRKVGTSAWQMLANTNLVNRTQDQQRRSFRRPGLEKGQYEVRATMNPVSNQGKGSQIRVSWSNLLSIKEDLNSYDGLPQVGFTIRASGQFSGTVDQVVVQNTAKPMPIWTETGWAVATTRENGLSNPGAQMLLYARGIYDERGRFIGGMDLDDEEIDIEAIKGFTLNCARRNYRFDYQLKDDSNHADFLDKLTLAGMGQWSWAGGKLSVVWADEDQPINGVVNMANIDDAKFQVEYAMLNSADGIEYTFYNRAKGKSETIRIKAPGVETMLHPSRVSVDGVTEFDHALTMARYHLAQSLYQVKDVGFSTDLEALSYRRMSLITVSHDLTQWGYGGRLEAYDPVRKALLIDDVIPARPANQSWVGVRIPGEDGYRVMKAAVNLFDGAREIIITDDWPAGSPLPDSSDEYPADAFLWCWDIKQTLGATMRVTDLSFNTDFETAEVSAVMETPEFWHFVKTGDYIPPKDISDLPSRPVVSNLRITEVQAPQDSTLLTTLDVIWDASGYVSNTYVYCNLDGEERVVAGTTPERRFQIPINSPGKYIIRVQPYGLDGAIGIPAQTFFDTALIGLPPPKFDKFEVNQLDAGFRQYVWGYNADTIVPANYAGAELRYHTTGQIVAWEDMRTLGGVNGFHTSSFQDVIPEAGNWTFVARPRSSAGTLGEPSVVSIVLTGSAVEVIVGIGEDLEEEIESRLKGDYDEAQARIAADNLLVADLLNETNLRIAADTQIADNAKQYTDEQIAALNAILNDILGAEEWNATDLYTVGQFVQHNGYLWRAEVENTNAEPGVSSAWLNVGEFDSVGEALAAAISMATTNASDILAQASRIDAVVAQLPANGEAVATSASVVAEAQARTQADQAFAQDLVTVQADLAGKASTTVTDLLTTNVSQIDGRVSTNTSAITVLDQKVDGKASNVAVDNLTAAVNDHEGRITANTNQILSLNTKVDGKADATALQSLGTRVTTVEGSVSTLSTAMTNVQASIVGLESSSPNLLKNPTFAAGREIWLIPAAPAADVSVPGGIDGPYATLRATGANVSQYIYQDIATGAGHQFWLGADVFRAAGQGTAVLYLEFWSQTDQYLASITAPITGAIGVWLHYKIGMISPAGTARVRVVLAATSTTELTSLRRVKLERNAVATPYSDDQLPISTAQAVSSLNASVTDINGKITTQATALTNVRASLNVVPNMLLNSSWDNSGDWWGMTTGTVYYNDASSGSFCNMPVSSGTGIASFQNVATTYVNRRYWFSADVYLNDGVGVARIDCAAYNTAGTAVASNTMAADPSVLGRWQRVAVWLDAPSATANISVRIISEGKSGTTSWRRAKLEMSDYATAWTNTREMTALASATNTLTTSVNNHEGRITANANAITNINATLPNKADTSVTQNLNAAIDQHETRITANAGQINSINASLPGKASASVVQSLEAKVNLNSGAGNNLLSNTSFRDGMRGWYLVWNPGAWEYGLAIGGPDYEPQNGVSIGMRAGPAKGATDYGVLGCQERVTVVGGKTYLFSVYHAQHRCVTRLALLYFDAAGNQITGSAESAFGGTQNQGGRYLSSWNRTGLKAVAPANAATAAVQLWVTGTGEGNPYSWFSFPMLEECLPDTVAPSPWSAGGAETFAGYSLYVNANNKIGGLQVRNNGSITSFDILADIFRISGNGSPQRTEYSDGNWRIYDGNGVLRVQMGVGF